MIYFPVDIASLSYTHWDEDLQPMIQARTEGTQNTLRQDDTSLQVVPMDPPKLCCFQWNNSLSKYLLEPSPSFWIFVSPWPDFAHLLAVSGSVWSCPLHIKIINVYWKSTEHGKIKNDDFMMNGFVLKKMGTNFCTPVHPLVNYHYCILYDPYSEGHIPGYAPFSDKVPVWSFWGFVSHHLQVSVGELHPE